MTVILLMKFAQYNKIDVVTCSKEKNIAVSRLL